MDIKFWSKKGQGEDAEAPTSTVDEKAEAKRLEQEKKVILNKEIETLESEPGAFERLKIGEVESFLVNRIIAERKGLKGFWRKAQKYLGTIATFTATSGIRMALNSAINLAGWQTGALIGGVTGAVGGYQKGIQKTQDASRWATEMDGEEGEEKTPEQLAESLGVIFNAVENAKIKGDAASAYELLLKYRETKRAIYYAKESGAELGSAKDIIGRLESDSDEELNKIAAALGDRYKDKFTEIMNSQKGEIIRSALIGGVTGVAIGGVLGWFFTETTWGKQWSAWIGEKIHDGVDWVSNLGHNADVTVGVSPSPDTIVPRPGNTLVPGDDGVIPQVQDSLPQGNATVNMPQQYSQDVDTLNNVKEAITSTDSFQNSINNPDPREYSHDEIIKYYENRYSGNPVEYKDLPQTAKDSLTQLAKVDNMQATHSIYGFGEQQFGQFQQMLTDTNANPDALAKFASQYNLDLGYRLADGQTMGQWLVGNKSTFLGWPKDIQSFVVSHPDFASEFFKAISTENIGSAVTSVGQEAAGSMASESSIGVGQDTTSEAIGHESTKSVASGISDKAEITQEASSNAAEKQAANEASKRFAGTAVAIAALVGIGGYAWNNREKIKNFVVRNDSNSQAAPEGNASEAVGDAEKGDKPDTLIGQFDFSDGSFAYSNQGFLEKIYPKNIADYQNIYNPGLPYEVQLDNARDPDQVRIKKVIYTSHSERFELAGISNVADGNNEMKKSKLFERLVLSSGYPDAPKEIRLLIERGSYNNIGGEYTVVAPPENNTDGSQLFLAKIDSSNGEPSNILVPLDLDQFKVLNLSVFRKERQ